MEFLVLHFRYVFHREGDSFYASCSSFSIHYVFSSIVHKRSFASHSFVIVDLSFWVDAKRELYFVAITLIFGRLLEVKVIVMCLSKVLCHGNINKVVIVPLLLLCETVVSERLYWIYFLRWPPLPSQSVSPLSIYCKTLYI